MVKKKKQKTLISFLDSEKAFYSICRQILPKNLNALGFDQTTLN